VKPWAPWFEAISLCGEAQLVIAFRMLRLAGGGAAAAGEAQRMVIEKVVANAQAQFAAGA
jgi:hypothetical protein